ncbi:hypothetical protein GCM10027435_01810 [Haloparvum alkalitolerans]
MNSPTSGAKITRAKLTRNTSPHSEPNSLARDTSAVTRPPLQAFRKQTAHTRSAATTVALPAVGYPRARGGVFNTPGVQLPRMKSTRKGLRDGDLFKDTYERLNCAACEKVLKKQNDPDKVYSVRICPECEAEFKELR